MIDICGNYVREQTNYSVYNGGYFAIITDEVTDASNNHSVLGMCNRMLDTCDPNNPVIKEAFVQLERTNSETVCTKLVECYKSHGIYLNKVRAQTYDTTSSMLSSLNGVQGRFRSQYPMAVYLPCNAHILNLSISASCKLQPIRDETFLFFHNSPKRQSFFERVLCLENFNAATQTKLIGLCRTRWVERHEAYENFFELIPAIVTTTDMIAHPHLYDDAAGDWSWDKETKETANGLQSAIKRFENIVAFIVLKNVLHPLKGISAKLQKRDLDIYDAYKWIDDKISYLQAFRGDVDSFHGTIYEEAKNLADFIDSIEERPRTARAGMRQEHRSNVPAESITEYFKRSISIPFLDYIISEMKTRFSETNRQAVMCILSLIPKQAILEPHCYLILTFTRKTFHHMDRYDQNYNTGFIILEVSSDKHN